MMKKTRIAIDGPGGAGKSTIAKQVAKKLNIEYIDTGAMYRAIAYKTMLLDIAPDDEQKIEEILPETVIDFVNGSIILDGKNIDDKIRTPQISMQASKVSQLPAVRKKLVDLQKQMAISKNVVMDGRDIGTNVIKDAEYKFFMTATAEERATRRYKELIEKGKDTKYEDVLMDIKKRDEEDTTRKLNPLKPADDAKILDTTKMSIEEVVSAILSEVR